MVCQGDASEEPERSRSALVPGIQLLKGEWREGKDFI